MGWYFKVEPRRHEEHEGKPKKIKYEPPRHGEHEGKSGKI
jgi:hypothetical protein